MLADRSVPGATMPGHAAFGSMTVQHPAPARRRVDLVVVSDVHLGTRACHAEALLAYLESVEPAELVLNGDIVDLREIHRDFWPSLHGQLLRTLLALAERIPVTYITGNHDAILRSLAPLMAGRLHLADQLIREFDGERTLILHGDGIEHRMAVSRVVRRVGCWAYHSARRIERWAARAGVRLDLVAGLKATPRAALHIQRFEDSCAAEAARLGVDAIVTGHIHAPRVRDIAVGDRSIRYRNSGDWVDSRSALEFVAGAGWSLVRVDPQGRVRDHHQAATAAPAPATTLASDPDALAEA